MIDAVHEALMRLNAVGRRVNPTRPPHAATVWRWALNGVRGVRLETIMIGGVRHTSEEAVARFIASLNEPGSVPTPPSAAAQRAGEQLRALGV